MIVRFLGAQWFAAAFIGVVSFALSVLVARTFGPDLYGVYATAMAAGGIAITVLDAGFSKLLLREHARSSPGLEYDRPRLAAYGFGHVLAAGLALSVLSWSLVPGHAGTVLAALWFFVALALNNIGLAVLRGQGRLVRDAGWQVVNRTLSALLAAGAIFLGFATLPAHIFLAQCLGAGMFAIFIARTLDTGISLRIPRRIYLVVAPLIWIDLATAVYFRADIVLFHFLGLPKGDAGHYGVAYRMMEAVILVAAPVSILLFRRFRIQAGSAAGGLAAVWFFALGAAIAGMCVWIGFVWLGDEVIAFAFGQAYAPAASLLNVLGLALVFLLPAMVLLQAALAAGLERWCAVSATLAAVFNVLANLLLVPRYGAIAAAYVTVATEVLILLALSAGLCRNRIALRHTENA